MDVDRIANLIDFRIGVLYAECEILEEKLELGVLDADDTEWIIGKQAGIDFAIKQLTKLREEVINAMVS